MAQLVVSPLTPICTGVPHVQCTPPPPQHGCGGGILQVHFGHSGGLINQLYTALSSRNCTKDFLVSTDHLVCTDQLEYNGPSVLCWPLAVCTDRLPFLAPLVCPNRLVYTVTWRPYWWSALYGWSLLIVRSGSCTGRLLACTYRQDISYLLIFTYRPALTDCT